MEIAARLELEDLEEFRRLETELRVLESGQGNLSWDQACAIVDAHRDCWIRMYEKYDLEDDEIHEVDTIRGIIFVGEKIIRAVVRVPQRSWKGSTGPIG